MNPYTPVIRYMYQAMLREGMLNLPGMFISVVAGKIVHVNPPMGAQDLHPMSFLPLMNLNVYANWGMALRGLYVALSTGRSHDSGYGAAYFVELIETDIKTYWRAME